MTRAGEPEWFPARFFSIHTLTRSMKDRRSPKMRLPSFRSSLLAVSFLSTSSLLAPSAWAGPHERGERHELKQEERRERREERREEKREDKA
ncbi:MAG TPA: hypothetical protein VIU64_09015, partial [Polyangia bacterium]